MEIDGRYPQATKLEIAPGCHIIVFERGGAGRLASTGSGNWGGHKTAYARYFVFQAVANHTFTIERAYRYVPASNGFNHGPYRVEYRELVERDENGREIRRHRQITEDTAPASC